MKKISNTLSSALQWAFAVLCFLGVLVYGFTFGSLLILLAGLIAMPIKPVRKFLREKLKVKTLVAVLLSIVLFVGGCMVMPQLETDVPIDETTVTTTEEEEEPATTVAQTTEELTSEVATTEKPTTEPTTETATSSIVANKENLSSNKVSVADIPNFSGKAYIAVNGNKPYFTESEITSQAFETYTSLDSNGRCGVAMACCGAEIMPGPGEERGSISSIKPSGWVQAQYDCVSGKYLYNRCHLIGWQLSAENANRRNLITGTKYLNIEGMLPFENMVADYINETGNHVMYRITPIFKGNNLVASGVQMEAYSVEDGGDGICFNVYCYNVQPGVVINYATGSSYLEGGSSETSTKKETTTKETTTKAPTTTNSGSHNVSASYILNTNTKKVHYPGCRSVKQMADKNKQEYNGSLDDILSRGYTTCGNCF